MKPDVYERAIYAAAPAKGSILQLKIEEIYSVIMEKDEKNYKLVQFF